MSENPSFPVPAPAATASIPAWRGVRQPLDGQTTGSQIARGRSLGCGGDNRPPYDIMTTGTRADRIRM
jgi:hypothetical protein